LRFGLRLLRFNPAFAAAAILSLALGIGRKYRNLSIAGRRAVAHAAGKASGTAGQDHIDHRNGASGSFSTRYPDLTYGQWEQIRAQQQAFTNVSPGARISSIFRRAAKFTMYKGSG